MDLPEVVSPEEFRTALGAYRQRLEREELINMSFRPEGLDEPLLSPFRVWHDLR